MAYVGTPIDTQNQFQSLQGKRFSGDGSTTAFTLDIAPSSVFDIEVFVENVRQDPNSAYSISGTTLTFTGAPPSGTNNIYVVHQAKAVGTIDVPASGVVPASLASNIISGQTELAATPADTDELLISDAGTIKRVDYSHIKASNTPAFFVYKGDGTNQTISSNTYTKVEFSVESIDTDSDFASNRFTPTTAGKYFLFANIALDASSSNYESGFVSIYKNGSQLYEVTNQQTNNNANHINVFIQIVEDANGSSDYFEVFAKCTDSSGSPAINAGGGARRTTFGGYKLIGV